MESSPAAPDEALRQLDELISSIDEPTFRRSSKLLPGGTIGSHVRHCIEFYQCLIDGVEDCRVDYDARRREPGMEASPLNAKRALRQVISNGRALLADKGANLALDVRESADDWRNSSLGRELGFVFSHTMHHLALIGVILREAGVDLPEGFGVAPSTQRFMQCQAAS
ncbi:MAG: DinB family protein [Verrucomicrobiota bacterium JB023]|nr:DinB family protein [Verrucomicrobiota bacterium JB023]